LSVSGALFIGFTIPHGVVASGSMLMAVIGIAAVAAVVASVNVISMGPTIVRIVETLPAGSGHLVVAVLIVGVVLVVVVLVVGVLVVVVLVVVGIVVVSDVAARIVVTAVVVGIVVGIVVVVISAVGHAGLKLLHLVAKLGNFSILDRILLDSCSVGGLETSEHVSIGGGGCGEVGKGLTGVISKVGDGVVGIVEPTHLGSVSHLT
jgi:hypothetical protein